MRFGLRPHRPALLTALVCLVAAGITSACRADLGLSRALPEAEPRASLPAELRQELARADKDLGSGRPEAALRMYQGATRRSENSVRAHLQYIAAMQRYGRRTAVREEYASRAGTAAGNHVLQVMNERLKTDGSTRELRRVYALARQQDRKNAWWSLALAELDIGEADRWNQQRLEAIDRGDHDAEREAYDKARAALEEAERAVKVAAEQAPNAAEVSMYRGFLRATEGDLQTSYAARSAAWLAAREALVRATRTDPSLGEAWEALGDVHFRLGSESQALEAFIRAARLAPADGHVRYALGVVLAHRGDHPAAIRQYGMAARLVPWDAEIELALGDALAEEERWDEALSAYERALTKDSEANEAWFRIGMVHEYLGQLPRARDAFERYLAAGGVRASAARRRIDRLLEDGGD